MIGIKLSLAETVDKDITYYKYFNYIKVYFFLISKIHFINQVC